MGYFSNGTEGSEYEAEYCSRCVHEENDEETGCAVWMLHFLHNPDGANDPDHFLNALIPRHDAGQNEECTMFHENEG